MNTAAQMTDAKNHENSNARDASAQMGEAAKNIKVAELKIGEAHVVDVMLDRKADVFWYVLGDEDRQQLMNSDWGYGSKRAALEAAFAAYLDAKGIVK